MCFQFIIEEQTNQLVRLDPVLKAIRKSHYQYITELRVWDISLQHSTVADIVSGIKLLKKIVVGTKFKIFCIFVLNKILSDLRNSLFRAKYTASNATLPPSGTNCFRRL